MNELATITDWYQKSKRTLPWRMDKDPYHIWISEIMLQQTRIEAVKNYYQRFMKAIPDINTLATISENKLLKLWEGLGYYNRARNLQKAAIMIMNEYQGQFPNTYENILTLPGIGEYTAAAIASISFNEKVATVDGNVLRVYMRITACYDNVMKDKVKRRVKEELQKIIPNKAGDFNEGMMELGETICLPNGEPKCKVCPLKEICLSYQKEIQNELPIRIKKNNKKIEELTVLLLHTANKIGLSYRDHETLLKNMWEFPNIKQKLTKKEIIAIFEKNNIISIKKDISYQHIFTHKIWKMDSYTIEIKKELPNYTWVTLEEIKEHYAIPTAFQPFLKSLENNFNETR